LKRALFRKFEIHYSVMKTLLSLTLALLLSATTFAQGGLKYEFQSAFLNSIKGLENSAANLHGFDRSLIAKIESLGVFALTAEKEYPSLADAETALAKLTDEIATFLPVGEFNSRRTYSANYAGSMKTLFEFNSSKMADQQKRPTIEMGIVETGSNFTLTLTLFEPYFKNQYKPVMP